MDGDEESVRLADLCAFVGLEPLVYARSDVEELTGRSSDDSRRWWRAMGFPDVPGDELGFGDSDVAMVRSLAALVGSGMVDESAVLRLARLLGASFSRIAEAQVGTLDDILARIPDPAAGPGPAADPRSRVESLIAGGDATLVELLADSLTYVWRRHLLAALGRWLSNEGDVTLRAVGFADIAGFTRLSRGLDPGELALTIEGFETAAFDVVATRGGRVVKLIGDEVMFVAGDLPAAVDIALDLIDAMGDVAATPSLHCGVAFGSTVDVGGDVFGPTVNLASRLTRIAHPDRVIVPRDVADALGSRPGVVVHPVRRVYDLKGIGRTPVVSVTRSGGGEGSRRRDPSRPTVRDPRP